MNGNCHLVFGTSVGVATAIMTDASPDTAVALISTCLIGSIFCDIDSETSHVGQLTKPVSTLICKISAVFGKTRERHRGIFHDPIIYIIGLVLSYLYLQPLMGFFIGALSHLLLDTLNPAGIPILGIKRIHIAKIPAGSKTAIVVTWILSILVFAIPLVRYINLTL